MSVRRLAPPEVQPKEFAFTEANLAWAKQQVAKYPEGRQQSAIIRCCGGRRNSTAAGCRKRPSATSPISSAWRISGRWKSRPSTRCFILQPCGKKAHVQVCGTTPCRLRGADGLFDVCHHRISHEPFEISADGNFSWEEVECLGACVNAPMVLIWNDTYEDLTPESFEKVLDGFAAGKPPTPGPQNGRQFSAPIGGPDTLTDKSIYETSKDGEAAAGDTALLDRKAKTPGEAANVRESPAPPPAGDKAKPKLK